MKLDEIVDIEKTPVKQTKETPDEVPGGATVCILNDPITPAEVVVEAIMHGTGLSESEAAKRMMRAHKNGWVPVAAYATVDIAESVAKKIENHARNNTRYDLYRKITKHHGPWPLCVEVMDAQE